jgi:hypothetical protein
MDPVIIAAIISGTVALISVLVVAYFTHEQNRNLKRQIEHLKFEEGMKYPLSGAYSGGKAKIETPNTFDLEYKSERDSLLECWNNAQAERMLDRDSKEALFLKKASDYQEKADSLWNSSTRGDRYRSALFYVLAAEASVLRSDFARAGAFYHYAAMTWRTLEEWERSGGYYFISARCHLGVNTEVELRKARRSLTRSMAAYEAGGNYEGYEIAKAKYQKVIETLKSEYGWIYSLDCVDDFEQLLKLIN